ncbi:MAG: lasso peptide biosynthesis B2 protein [Candidatus Nanopelagicales bacterium]
MELTRRPGGKPLARVRSRLRRRAANGEALVLLVAGSAAQRWLPFARWGRVLGQPTAVPQTWRGRPIAAPPPLSHLRRERAVAVTVRRAAVQLPWQPSCLAQATAGQLMLRRRGMPGVAVLGLRAAVRPDGEMDSHAWLLGLGGAITGAREAVGFTPVSVYQVPGSATARLLAVADG